MWARSFCKVWACTSWGVNVSFSPGFPCYSCTQEACRPVSVGVKEGGGIFITPFSQYSNVQKSFITRRTSPHVLVFSAPWISTEGDELSLKDRSTLSICQCFPTLGWYFLYPRVFQPWHCWHFRLDYSWLWTTFLCLTGCVSNILGLYPPDARSILPSCDNENCFRYEK